MFCHECGTQCKDDALFCTNCGTKLILDFAETAPQPAPEPEPVVQPATGFEPVSEPEPIAPQPATEWDPFGVPAQGNVASTPQPEAFRPEPVQLVAEPVAEPEPVQPVVEPVAAEPVVSQPELEQPFEPALNLWQPSEEPAAPQPEPVAPTGTIIDLPQEPVQPVVEASEVTRDTLGGAPASQPVVPIEDFAPVAAAAAPVAVPPQSPAAPQPVAAEQPPAKKPKTGLIIAIVAIVAVAAIVVAGFLTNWFGLAGPGQADITPRPNVNAYTWEELGQISDQIAAAASDDDAIEIAKGYNLVNEKGKLTGAKKTLTLTDGTETAVQIVGFRHDDRSGGSGKAGITFVFTYAVTLKSTNAKDTNVGGWKDSAMREYLNGDFSELIPEDLAAQVVPVEKATNNVGETNDKDSVTATSDTFWLLSAHEVAGDAEWSSKSTRLNKIINAEGSQYQLFSDKGVSFTDKSSKLLARTLACEKVKGTKYVKGDAVGWVFRTPDPATSESFRHVDREGGLASSIKGGSLQGVAPGFCI